MAIRGGLAEFSVPELLQLLSLQQKTGVLTLTHKKGDSHVLFFWRGRVLAAADRRRSNRHLFLCYLNQNQLLTTDQVDSVEDIGNSTGQDIFTVVLASGIMSRDRLTEEMRSFTQRIADSLMDWVDGTYDFSPTDEKSLPPQGLPLNLNPEELVLESMRRMDELATMKESMLAPDLLLAQVREAPSDPLPRETTLVLKLIDGTQTIEEICKLSPLGEYLTYEAIADLLKRQRIMIVDSQQAGIHTGSKQSRVKVSWPTLAAILALVAGSALLGTGLNPLLSKSKSSDGFLDTEVVERRAETRTLIQEQVETLENK